MEINKRTCNGISACSFVKQGSTHVDIFRSIRRLVARSILGGVFLCATFSYVNADVYLEAKKSLKDNTDAVVSMLSQAAVPGGVRSVTLNGNELLVKRFANPIGDKSEFFKAWKNVDAKKVEANAAILAVVDENGRRDPIADALTLGSPYRSPIDNLQHIVSAAAQFADSQSEKLKDKVTDAIETPFAYETSQHRVIARIPVRAIDANSSLARAESENGYLFMSEKSPGSTVSTAFWQMQFGNKFKFGDLFGSNGEDVKGKETDVARYPGSRMTLVFDESADGWHSQSWSYESNGDVLSHISHYVNALEQAGFTKDRGSVVQYDYGLVEFASRYKEATLFVELVDAAAHSVQVTLQIRGN